jgi:hypothetical protein
MRAPSPLVLVADLGDGYLVPARWLNVESRDGHLDRVVLVGRDNRPKVFGAMADDVYGPAGR